jgi:hypothetical protein
LLRDARIANPKRMTQQGDSHVSSPAGANLMTHRISKTSLDRLRLLLLHRTKMRIQSPCLAIHDNAPKETQPIRSTQRKRRARRTKRSCRKRIQRQRRNSVAQLKPPCQDVSEPRDEEKVGSRALCMRRFDGVFCEDWEVSTLYQE